MNILTVYGSIVHHWNEGLKWKLWYLGVAILHDRRSPALMGKP